MKTTMTILVVMMLAAGCSQPTTQDASCEAWTIARGYGWPQPDGTLMPDESVVAFCENSFKTPAMVLGCEAELDASLACVTANANEDGEVPTGLCVTEQAALDACNEAACAELTPDEICALDMGTRTTCGWTDRACETR